MKKTRLNIFLKPETMQEVRLLGDKLGMSRTGVASVAVELGMQAIKMSLDPKFHKIFEEKIRNELPLDRGLVNQERGKARGA